MEGRPRPFALGVTGPAPRRVGLAESFIGLVESQGPRRERLASKQSGFAQETDPAQLPSSWSPHGWSSSSDPMPQGRQRRWGTLKRSLRIPRTRRPQSGLSSGVWNSGPPSAFTEANSAFRSAEVQLSREEIARGPAVLGFALPRSDGNFGRNLISQDQIDGWKQPTDPSTPIGQQLRLAVGEFTVRSGVETRSKGFAGQRNSPRRFGGSRPLFPFFKDTALARRLANATYRAFRRSVVVDCNGTKLNLKITNVAPTAIPTEKDGPDALLEVSFATSPHRDGGPWNPSVRLASNSPPFGTFIDSANRRARDLPASRRRGTDRRRPYSDRHRTGHHVSDVHTQRGDRGWCRIRIG